MCKGVPVCMPREVPMTRTTKKRMRGSSPLGGGMFFLSVIAKMTMRKRAVAKNSSKKQDTFVR